MTKQEIFKYFKEKHLFHYFKAFTNMEAFFTEVLGNPDFLSKNRIGFTKDCVDIEQLIKTKYDLKRIEKEINKMFKEKGIHVCGVRTWGLSLYYKYYHRAT